MTDSSQKPTLTSKTVTFDSLPLGARFRYPGKNDVWVKLENGGCGIVAEWSDPQLNWPGQGIYSFADSEQQRVSGQVEWIDRSSSETGACVPTDLFTDLLEVVTVVSTMDCFYSGSTHKADCECIVGKAERAIARVNAQKAEGGGT